MSPVPTCLLLALLAFTCLPPVTGEEEAPPDPLRQGFQSPPASARPWTYFFIMDGHLTREGITADFEAMKAAGLGGMVIMEVDVGIPRGPVKFMSPEWRKLFVHAVREAERLGLEITLNAGPGWTGSGGPWVKAEQSMQHLVASETRVTGPASFEGVLPQPPPRRPFFGEGALPPDQEKVRKEFYRDVFVLAYRDRERTARLADLEEKALYVRAPYSSQPGVRATFPDALAAEVPDGPALESRLTVDLTGRLQAGGRLQWDVPEGDWVILRFGATSTGANTRPAPLPGLGLESDKFDRAALEAHFDAFAGTLLRELGPRGATNAGWTSLHIDSWEMGAQNWSPAFREEFTRRRGYDPLKYLPVLTGVAVDSAHLSERFLWDWRQTAQELVVENHATHLRELGRRHGLGLSIEPYDMNPCADLSLGAVADTPMCEFWLHGFNTFFTVTEAASLAHTLGRPVVAAEAFTSTDAERWQAYPGSMKTLGDWAFSAGVNRIVFHRYQHQPWLDRRPGMTMGPYGVHWERTQTWWPLVPAYHQYLARCQWMLRRGLPVADVLFLSAEGAPHVFLPPADATTGHPPQWRGYAFDACAPEILRNSASVRDGRVGFPHGMSYRVLVLPDRETMTPGLLRKVRELAEAGATIIGPPPRQSPSLSGFPECDREIAALAASLWSTPPSAGGGDAASARGRVLWPSEARTPRTPRLRPPPLDQARWIWHAEGQPAAAAPVGRRWFRREFTLSAGQEVVSARACFTADNSFELWLNGDRVGAGDNFRRLEMFDVGALLRPGTNVLAVLAGNGGAAPNPAGLLGLLSLQFKDGTERMIATGPEWSSRASAPPEGWRAAVAAAGWSQALDLGPAGMSPWGQPASDQPAPPQYGPFAFVEQTLAGLDVPPDFEAGEPLRYHHRRDGEIDLYFVASPATRTVETTATFRVAGRRPELWDPVTGEIRPLPRFTVIDGRTRVPLRFEPAQAFFIVFREPGEPGPSPLTNFAEVQPVQTVAGPWSVTFDPRTGGPGEVTFAALEDWTVRTEPGIRHYSGLATYRTTLVRSGEADRAGKRVFLDLGAVHSLARVTLNGREAGVVWTAPWRVDITGLLRAGSNDLEIVVANLWPNRLIGDAALPEAQRSTWTTWNPFTPDTPLLPSGLLGPVRVCHADP